MAVQRYKYTEMASATSCSASEVAGPEMGTSSLARRSVALLTLLCLLLPCHGKLSTKFYAKSCPGVATTVRSVMAQAVAKELRMGASIIRLFFHDCFVNVGHIYIVS